MTDRKKIAYVTGGMGGIGTSLCIGGGMGVALCVERG